MKRIHTHKGMKYALSILVWFSLFTGVSFAQQVEAARPAGAAMEAIELDHLR
jgi:hypothetical protein